MFFGERTFGKLSYVLLKYVVQYNKVDGETRDEFNVCVSLFAKVKGA